MSKNRHKSSPQSTEKTSSTTNPANIHHETSKSPAISILVPIYNVERYLEQCLESLVNQTLKDIEIICLNDGSTDGSSQILQAFQKRDPRIRVINKPNSGYGDSMNQGLKKATGEYIGIVESDDYIDLDAFEKLYTIARAYKAEVVRANYYFNQAGQDTKNLYINPGDAGRILNPKRHTWIFYQAPAIWSAIYKRKFLEKNQIKFLPTPGASYQDTGFNFKVWATAERAYFTTNTFLHYRTDNESSSVNNPGKIFNVCYEYEEIEKYLHQHHLFEELGPLMEATKFGAYYWNIFRLVPKLLPDFINRTRTEFRQAKSEKLLYESFFASSDQWKMLNYILKHSTRRCIFYIRRQHLKQTAIAKSKKIWIKTHPSYAKQKQISALIDEAYAEYDALEAYLKTKFSKTQLGGEL